MKSLSVLFVLAAAAGSLVAQDEKQIQDALRGLGAESFEERERATADLKKIGAPALDALRKASKEDPDPEVRARAKRLVDEIAKPAPRKRTDERIPTVRGSRISIRQTAEGTVYGLTPADGDAIEFTKGNEGKVKLSYPDGKGGTKVAEAESIEKFVADQPELAAKYGITKDAIDYGGTKLPFGGVMAVPGWKPLELPVVPMPPMKEMEDLFAESDALRKAFDDLRKWRGMADRPDFFAREVIRGVQLSPVPDVLRSQLGIPEGQGVVVEAVRENSTGAAAGLKRHDVILEIDGQKVAGAGDVRTLLKRDSKVKTLRGGKEQELQAAPAGKREY